LNLTPMKMTGSVLSLMVLWEPTPVGDGLWGVFHAHRPRGGLLQKNLRRLS